MFNNQIVLAIREKRVLRITYDFKSRLVEPHAYGVSQEDNELLRAWQLTPIPEDWKLFRLDKATGISITDTKFLAPRPDYNRADPALKSAYAEL